MAINVNTVYKTVLLILNKEQRGYMTPEEFNKIGTQVQLEIFEKYFEDLSQAARSMDPGAEYSDRIAYLEEKLSALSVYEKGQVIGPGVLSGTSSGSNEVHRLNTATYNGIEVQRISRSEYLSISKSTYTKPLETQPVLVQEKGLFYVYPESIASDVYFSFIKKPKDVLWNFQVDQNLGVYTYTVSGSQNFELHSSDQTEVILRILSYAGIVLNNPQIVQAASAAVQTQNINEKS